MKRQNLQNINEKGKLSVKGFTTLLLDVLIAGICISEERQLYIFMSVCHTRMCTFLNIIHKMTPNQTCVVSEQQPAALRHYTVKIFQHTVYLTVYDKRAWLPFKRKPFALHLPLLQVNDSVTLLLALGRLLSTHRL